MVLIVLYYLTYAFVLNMFYVISCRSYVDKLFHSHDVTLNELFNKIHRSFVQMSHHLLNLVLGLEVLSDPTPWQLQIILQVSLRPMRAHERIHPMQNLER